MRENRMEVAVTDDLGDLQKFTTQPTNSHKNNPCGKQSITFVARSEVTNVQFTGLGNDNTLGLLLHDDISLTKQPTFTAPTPTTRSLSLLWRFGKNWPQPRKR